MLLLRIYTSTFCKLQSCHRIYLETKKESPCTFRGLRFCQDVELAKDEWYKCHKSLQIMVILCIVVDKSEPAIKKYNNLFLNDIVVINLIMIKNFFKVLTPQLKNTVIKMLTCVLKVGISQFTRILIHQFNYLSISEKSCF